MRARVLWMTIFTRMRHPVWYLAAVVVLRATDLPFLCAPEVCSTQPLCMVFDSAHFMPLVATAEAADKAVHYPLCDKEYAELPIRVSHCRP